MEELILKHRSRVPLSGKVFLFLYDIPRTSNIGYLGRVKHIGSPKSVQYTEGDAVG